MKISVAGRDGRFPSKDGATQSFLVESEKGSKILLDMGAGSLAKLWNYTDPCKLDAIFLSHLHFDHFCDLCIYFQLLQYYKIPPKDIYMPSSPEEQVELLDIKKFYHSHFYENESSLIHIGDIEIQPVPLLHPIESYGFRVKCDGKCLVYTGDSVECENLTTLLKEADVVLADACISESDALKMLAPPHIKASRLAELTDPKALLLLTHLAENQQTILQETKDKHPNTLLAEYKSYVIG